VQHDSAAIGVLSTARCCSERSDNLDNGWLKVDDTTGAKELPKPDQIVAMIQQRLRMALEETGALNAQLDCSE